MSDKLYGVEIRIGVRARNEEEAGMLATKMILTALDARFPILPIFAVEVHQDPGSKPDKSESPKAEDVFGRIMSSPDVQ